MAPAPNLDMMGILYGFLVSAALAVTGFWALRWASNKSQQIFTGVILGGFLFRVIVVGAAVFTIWKFTTIDGMAFTVSLLVSYLLFQVIETVYFQNLFKRMKAARRV
jgi:hypothetical protein